MIQYNPLVIILAAGESQRFKAKGYMTPKPFLPISYKGITCSMVQHVFRTIPERFENTALVTKTGMLPDIATRFALDKTEGQADSLLQALKIYHSYEQDTSVLVLDCDMLLQKYDLDILVQSLSMFEAAVAVTPTFDPNASRVNTVPFPTAFAEKEPISEWGMVGARAFRSSISLQLALQKSMLEAKSHNKEPYLSTALNFYPGTKFAHIITSYTDWGTPERLAESGAIIV